MDTHKHKCRGCGFVWEHSEAMRGNEDAHTCVCGREEWRRMDDDSLIVACFRGCGRPMRGVVGLIVRPAAATSGLSKAICCIVKYFKSANSG